MKKIILFLFAILCSTSMFAWKISSNFVSGNLIDWEMTDDISGDSFTSGDLLANTVYKLRVFDGGAKGFGALDPATVVCGLYGDAAGDDCNICFILKEAGKVTVTNKSGKIAVTGKFDDFGVILHIEGYTGTSPKFDLSSDKLSATYTIKADTLKKNTDLKFQLQMPGGFLSDNQGLTRTRTESNVFYMNNALMPINLDQKGDYVLTYNFASRKLSVVYPELETKYYVHGNFGSDDEFIDCEMTEASGVWSVGVTPAIERTKYEFKIKRVDGFYEPVFFGDKIYGGEMTKDNCTGWELTSNDPNWNINMTPADIVGPYRFQFTPAGTLLSVVYPALEVYMEFDGDHTLTYYYDILRNSRAGVTEVYRPDHTYPVRDGYDNKKVTRVVVDKSMKNAELTSTYYMFGRGNYDYNGLPNVEVIEGLSNLNTSKVTSMLGMFYGCKKLVSLDLSSFNTANVENMSNMFYLCESLTSLTFGNFNTANVTNMSNMFGFCESMTSFDLTSFDIAKVEKSYRMFVGCTKLQTIYCDQDFSASTVLIEPDYYKNMFDGCSKLVGGNGTKFDGTKIDKTWARVDRGTGNEGYFTASKKVYTVYTDANKTLTYYCDNKHAAREGIVKIYDPSEDAHFSSSYAPNVEKIVVDASMADTLLTSMKYFFSSGGSNQQLKNATDITGLNYLKTTNVKSMDWMFYGCAKLKVLDLTSFETPNLINMAHMFVNCYELEKVDISSFNTAKVTSTRETFLNCAKLTAINLTNADFSKVSNMTRMFAENTALVTIWSTQDLSGNSFESDGQTGVFLGSSYLEGGKGTKYNASYIKAEYPRPDGENPGYFTSTDTLDTLIEETIESLNALITKPHDAAEKIVNNARNDVASYEWDLNRTLTFNVNGFNATYDLNWFMEIKNQVFNAYDYDAKKKELARAISELQDLYNFANNYADATTLQPIQDQINAANGVLNNTGSTLQQLTDAVTTANNALKSFIALILSIAKDEANKALDDLLEAGDSEACKQIIADAKAAVNAIKWNEFKNVKQNTESIKKDIEDIYNQAVLDLAAQREKDHPTAIDQVLNEQTGDGKFFRNGQLIIRRDSKNYTATGAEVK